MTATVDELERSVNIYRGLVEVSALINSITDFNELLSAILDVAGRVMHAEASSLFLINESTGDLELVIARGPVEAALSHPIKIPRGRGIASWVRENHRSVLVVDAYKDARFYPELDRSSGFVTRSILCIPLFQQETEIGVLQVLNPSDKPHFDRLDLEAFEAYGNLVATAIAKMRAIERERERKQLEKDLALATEIQHSFLPDVLPSTELLTVASHYRPARNIAGDFYDVFECSEGVFYFVVGDVSGKGVSAALLMAQAISMLRLIVHRGMSPTDALAKWNNRICDRTIHGMFITAILGRIFPEERLIEFAVAGHCPPWLRFEDGTVEEPPILAAPPLGIIRDQTYELNQIYLLPRSHAVFYTDGLIESFNADRKPMSAERVKKVLAESGTDLLKVVAALAQAEADYRGDVPPHDDMTVLAIGLK
ncbi:MAG: GAF domain-containing SpoIIE family protein phosphatase [Chthoniobacterales bacterium]